MLIITPTQVKEMILRGLPGARVEVQDMTGTSDHFDVLVEAPVFAGKTLVEQHRIVFALLEPEMDKRIHAVRLKTRAVQ